MKYISIALAMLLLIGALVLPVGASEDNTFLELLNQERTAAGVDPLIEYGSQSDYAREWSEQMSSTDTLSHRPQSEWQGSGILGQNVGVGWSVSNLHEAFVESPSHYRNMVDPQFEYVGIGTVVESSGKIWVTVEFSSVPIDYNQTKILNTTNEPSAWAAETWAKADRAGVITEYSDPHDTVTKQELMAFFERAGLLD